MRTFLAVAPEELRVAHALVEVAVEGMETAMPSALLAGVRRELLGRLIWTAWGREQLGRVLEYWN